ncbi:hypothetical protein Avbf_01979 [Armadillidium vulgare]|nr:hypothetical protein Avbf_01979 [Armadillidium vulgare]
MNDEIEILENITVNSMLENILTSTKEINQLNIDGGGGGNDEDDDDIICLDTVFKPKRIDDVNGTNFKTFKSQNANLDTRMSSTDLGHNSSTCFVSDLEKDEIPIDELISHPSNLNQSFNKEVSQKRLQDGNTPVEKPGKKLKRIYPKISTKISNDKTKVPMQHPIPPGSVLNVIILILKNVNCLTCKELWDYVSGIFPFFEDHFQEKPGYTKVRRILSKYKQFFLETRSKVTTKESVNLIMLNPAMHSEIDVVIRSIKEKREGFIKSMYFPELFDSLVNGNSKLSDVKLYHDRSVKTNHEFLPLNFKMSSVVSTNTSSTPAGASALKSFYS